MNYEDIRQARLQKPFRPFKLRMKSGEEHVIADPASLAISERIVAFPNSRTGGVEHWSPNAVAALTFIDESTQARA